MRPGRAVSAKRTPVNPPAPTRLVSLGCLIPPRVADAAICADPNGPPGCEQCGAMMVKTGDCFTCPACGNHQDLDE